MSSKKKPASAGKRIIKSVKNAVQDLRNKNSMPTTKKVVLEFPIEFVEQMQAIARTRGTTVSDMARLAMLALSRSSCIYKLDSKMSFGKYAGETVETVIRCDPSYIGWMIRTIERVSFAEECLQLLDEIDD